MKLFIIFLYLIYTPYFYGKNKGKTVYKYKKYQKFDFEDLVLEGDSGIPGDISITNRFQKKFKNQLPYRKSFNSEIIKSIESVR